MTRPESLFAEGVGNVTANSFRLVSTWIAGAYVTAMLIIAAASGPVMI